MSKKKDECNNCNSTESKTFWDYKDGTMLCDECHKKIGDSWEKKNKINKSKILLFIFALIIIMCTIFILIIIQENKELKKEQSDLQKEFANYKEKTNDDIVELKNQNSILIADKNYLSNEKEQIGTELIEKNKEYESLKTETEDTIKLIETYKSELQSSMQWFSDNSFLTDKRLTSKIKNYLENYCYKIKDNKCYIKTACFFLINEEKMNFYYQSDNITLNIDDKLQNISSFITNKGGDCEDYALFYKAEWNYVLNECKDKEIIVDSYHDDYMKERDKTRHYVDYKKDWYLTDDVNEISFTEHKYPNIICGNLYDFNSKENNGHCMIALTKERIKTISDLEYMKDSVIIEPQTGEFQGMMNELKISENGLSRTYLEPSIKLREEDSYIYQVITDTDHFSYSYEIKEWQSYSGFLNILDNKFEKLIEIIN